MQIIERGRQMITEITLQDICKNYGKKEALKHIDLTIPEGMFGLLGRNGAGKTTLMKILVTLLPADHGEISMCGIDIKNRREIRNMVGYLPQEFSMYGSMSVYETMDYLGTLSGLTKKERKARIPVLLEKVNLGENHHTKVKAMSGGMKRRLGIAQALLNDPKVLVVDEPTAGLDPEERVRFRNILSDIADNRIVILSTHIVGDIEASCEQIAILDEGNLKFAGTVAELLEQAWGKVYSAEISKAELDQVKQQYLVTAMHTKGSRVQIRFLSEEVPFKSAASVEPDVEDAYMYLMNRREER